MVDIPDKLLIVVVRQDDVTFGCGGLIKKWSANGCKIRVVFVTA